MKTIRFRVSMLGFEPSRTLQKSSYLISTNYTFAFFEADAVEDASLA
jgi:hypothetical protein